MGETPGSEAGVCLPVVGFSQLSEVFRRERHLADRNLDATDGYELACLQADRIGNPAWCNRLLLAIFRIFVDADRRSSS